MSTWHADRLSKLPPYLFVEIDRRKARAAASGRDIIDLGVGDADRPTPDFIVERVVSAIRQPDNHRYSASAGRSAFREAIAAYFKHRFKVDLDPATETLGLIGSKEGIGHLPTAVVNPGEVVLIPAPGYPVYEAGTVFAAGAPHPMPLREEHNWLPVLEDIPVEVLRRARLMYLNYPNNPTAAVADRAFFEKVVAFAREHDILVAQDAAYCDLYFADPPPSILEVDGAKDVCIEFHSLSKTFNMTGWRVGFAVGNPRALAALLKVKSNLDSGIFGAVQEAAGEALAGSDHAQVRATLDVYRQRRDILLGGLREAGWHVPTPPATFFVWAKCPGGTGSVATAGRILDEANVVVIPGAGFGKWGEGYVRFALTVEADRVREAAARIARLSW